jgi:AAA domain-containing protein
MPQVTKQVIANQPKTRPTNGQPSRAGSVLQEARSVSEVSTNYVKILLYGVNRCGKTHLACTFPKPLLLVSFEPSDTGGAITAKQFQGIDIIQIRTTEKASRLADELSRQSHYQTVVFDGVTSYQDIVLQEILGLSSLPEQLNFGTISGDNYRTRAERTKEGIRPWTKLPCHTVFLGKERDHNPPREDRVSEKTGKIQPDMRPRFLRGMQQDSFVAADLGGATTGWLQDNCPCVGRLYFDKEMITTEQSVAGKKIQIVEESGKYIRCLRIKYHPNYSAGIQSEKGDDNIPDVIENPTWEKIHAILKGDIVK